MTHNAVIEIGNIAHFNTASLLFLIFYLGYNFVRSGAFHNMRVSKYDDSRFLLKLFLYHAHDYNAPSIIETDNSLYMLYHLVLSELL